MAFKPERGGEEWGKGRGGVGVAVGKWTAVACREGAERGTVLGAYNPKLALGITKSLHATAGTAVSY